MKTKTQFLFLSLFVSAALCVSLFFIPAAALSDDSKVENENEEIHGQLPATNVIPAMNARIGTQIFMPASSFVSDGFDPDGYFHSFYGGYFEGVATSGACLAADVIFPVGSRRIRKLYIYAHDANTEASEWFDFYRVDLLTGGVDFLGSVSTSDSSGVVEYEIILSDKVLYKDYAYQITTCSRPDIYVYGAKIIYKSDYY